MASAGERARLIARDNREAVTHRGTLDDQPTPGAAVEGLTGRPSYAVLAAVIDAGRRLAASMELARQNGASTRDLANVLGLPQSVVERVERELAQ